MSMSNTLTSTSTPTLQWSRYRGQVLKGFGQMLWQMLILTSVKANRFRCWGRKSKRIVSSDDDSRRRRRNVEIQRRDQRRSRSVRRSMPLRAVQSPVRSFELLSCGACMLRGVRGCFGPLKNKIFKKKRKRKLTYINAINRL